jgi:hypothetical protein
MSMVFFGGGGGAMIVCAISAPVRFLSSGVTIGVAG